MYCLSILRIRKCWKLRDVHGPNSKDETYQNVNWMSSRHNSLLTLIVSKAGWFRPNYHSKTLYQQICLPFRVSHSGDRIKSGGLFGHVTFCLSIQM